MKTSPPALSTTSADATGPVTVVVTQHIKAGQEKAFMNWLHGIGAAAASFPGHLGLTVVSSAASDVCTYIFRFDSLVHLKAWEQSTEKEQWVAKLPTLVMAPADKRTVSGLEYWFQPPGQSTVTPPAKMKMTLLTLLAIYPLTLSLGIIATQFLRGTPLAVRSFAVSVVAVVLMTYLIMPWITRLFAFWLYPASRPATKDKTGF